jgi:hypothetical protein
MDKNPPKHPEIQPVRLGAELDKPREKCPDCGERKPRVLGVMDFPMESAEGVAQAMQDGADLYECTACQKRWAVMRVARPGQPMPAPKGPTQKIGKGRRYRRAVVALNQRAIEKNLRLAARNPMAATDDRPPAIDPDAARKARNARKAARRRGAS